MTEPEAVRVRLKEIRDLGYAWGFAEFDESINSVAAPITDHTGATVAALHIHGPAYRFPDPSQVDEIGRIVRQSADRLSEQLTY